MAAATTTIKVTPQLRDRINREAGTRGVTPSLFLEQLVDEWERQQRFQAVRDAYAKMSDEQRAGYESESTEWAANEAELPA